MNLDESDIALILRNLVTRNRFSYRGKDILEYLGRCLCLRSTKFAKFSGTKQEWEKSLRKHYHYTNGEDKLYDELDVITLLKSMRRVKLLTQTLLTQTQKMMLKFQRKNIIESSPSSGDSDTNNKFDTINLMESKDPMMRLVVISKIKKMVSGYRSKTLDDIDKRLLRGLFINHIKDFDEEQRLKMNAVTLYDRLMALRDESSSKRMEEWGKDESKKQIEIIEEEDEIELAHFESDHDQSIIGPLEDGADRSETRPRPRRKNSTYKPSSH